MQGIPEPYVPLPEIPPGGLKRCSGCRKYIEVSKDNFSTITHTLATGKKKRYWRSQCRACERANRKRQGYRTTWTKPELRARDRAATRLIKMVPKVFLPLFIEELKKAYKDAGLTQEEYEARLRYRTRYVKVLIQKAEQ